MTLKISRCTFSDVKSVCLIHNQAFSEWIDKLGMLYGYQIITENDVVQWLDSQESDILIAFENGKPIGYLHYQIVHVKGEKNDVTCMEIMETTEGRGQSKIAVIPTKQRKGVASMLLRHAIQISKEKDVNFVVVYAYNDNLVICNILQNLHFIHKRIFYYPPFSESKSLAHDAVLAEFDLLIQNTPRLIPSFAELTIREFNPTDLSDIQQIFIENRPDMVESSGESDIGNYWLTENWAEKTLVAELHGEVVGCMEYNKLGLIGIPGVKKKYQHQGIGTKLLSTLLKDMKSNGCRKALADTGVLFSKAIELYRKLDFDTARELWAWVLLI